MAETKDTIVKNLTQSPEVETEKNRLVRLVQDDWQRRNQETRFFRGTNLVQYTDASKAQFIGHRRKPEYKKDYQYNLFDPITRDKVYAILSKSRGMYEASFFNTNKKLQRFSETIATILGAFYKDSTRILKEKEKNKLLSLDALITPKAIWFEGWKYQKRAIRDIEERDEKTGEPTKFKKKDIVHYNGPWGEIVPVEDFVPGSLRIRDIQEQPRISWISKMQKEEFDRTYGKYSESKKVESYGVLFDNDLTEFTVRQDLKEKEVEVIKIFDKWEDRMSIIANGVLLTKIDSPMPFSHKDYPFAWGGFEEIDTQFIYDMPLPMKILDMQDMNNEILNLTLDMVWRALNEVVLVKSGDGINDDVLYGGGLLPVDDPNNFKKLEFGSSFGFNSATAMLERAKRSIESSAIDAYSSGQAGGKSPETARAVLVAKEAAMEITTLFLENMENMERDKAILRVKNQLDRYKMPIDWQKRVGDKNTQDAIAYFREISARDTRLDGGKRGTAFVNITETPRSEEELNKLNIENDKEMSQTIDVTPEFIRDIEFDVEIFAGSSVKRSKTQDIAEARQDLSDAIAAPNVLNVPYFAKEYIKTRGKNPDEALVVQSQNPMEEMLAKMSSAGKPEAKEPKEDSIESVINQAL